MALLEFDRNLLLRCLERKPRAWEDFVDRFLGLVVHVVRHCAEARSLRLSPQDVEDLAAEVFLTIVKDDYAVLRRFRRESSLASYLTVIARRVVIRELSRPRPATNHVAEVEGAQPVGGNGSVEQRLSDRDEVERLLSQLQGPEAEMVRLYHLEGLSYEQISQRLGAPENSIGPTLSRARAKLRRGVADAAPN